jgi:hypothetical protein
MFQIQILADKFAFFRFGTFPIFQIQLCTVIIWKFNYFFYFQNDFFTEGKVNMNWMTIFFRLERNKYSKFKFKFKIQMKVHLTFPSIFTEIYLDKFEPYIQAISSNFLWLLSLFKLFFVWFDSFLSSLWKNQRLVNWAKTVGLAALQIP